MFNFDKKKIGEIAGSAADKAADAFFSPLNMVSDVISKKIHGTGNAEAEPRKLITTKRFGEIFDQGRNHVTTEQIKEIIKEDEEVSDVKLGGLKNHATYMKIVLKNEGVSIDEWDEAYTDDMRRKAFEKADSMINEALGE